MLKHALFYCKRFQSNLNSTLTSCIWFIGTLRIAVFKRTCNLGTNEWTCFTRNLNTLKKNRNNMCEWISSLKLSFLQWTEADVCDTCSPTAFIFFCCDSNFKQLSMRYLNEIAKESFFRFRLPSSPIRSRFQDWLVQNRTFIISWRCAMTGDFRGIYLFLAVSVCKMRDVLKCVCPQKKLGHKTSGPRLRFRNMCDY